MRLSGLIGLSVALITISGCQGSTTPVRRDLAGSWTTKAFPGATLRMTLGETAREVRGAGSLITVNEVYGFEVGGALASNEVALIFRFDTRPDLSFQGSFDGEDILVGKLAGDPYRREDITFERVELPE